MNDSKLQQKLQGQSSTARKVYEAVSMQEPWTTTQIANEYKRLNNGAAPPVHMLRACLGALDDAGLIARFSADGIVEGLFKRTKVRETTGEANSSAIKHIPNLATPKAPALTTAQATKAPAKTEESVLDVLGALAKKCRGIADEIDAAALAIDETNLKNADKLKMIEQFKTLFKD